MSESGTIPFLQYIDYFDILFLQVINIINILKYSVACISILKIPTKEKLTESA